MLEISDLDDLRTMFDATENKTQKKALRTVAKSLFDEIFPCTTPTVNPFIADYVPESCVSRVSNETNEHLRRLFTVDEMLEWSNNKKLTCIKLVRKRTGMSLKDAKDYVELHLTWKPLL